MATFKGLEPTVDNFDSYLNAFVPYNPRSGIAGVYVAEDINNDAKSAYGHAVAQATSFMALFANYHGKIQILKVDFMLISAVPLVIRCIILYCPAGIGAVTGNLDLVP